MTTTPIPPGPDGDVPGSAPDRESPATPAEIYGAAPERTVLAWQRTGLGVVVGCFLIFHSSFQLGAWPVGAVAVALGLTVAVLAAFAFPTDRYLRGEPADSWRLLTAVSFAVAALGGLGAVIAVATLMS